MSPIFQEPIGALGARPVLLGEALGVAGVVGALLILWLVIAVLRQRAARRVLEARADAERLTLEGRLGEMGKAQAELSGRLSSVSELLANRQADLARLVSERMDGLGHKLGQSMREQARDTGDTLRTLHERLATIDAAQKNITELSRGVVQLQTILADKQTRGAFGQGRMEAIVQDNLPRGAYSFQHTLSNRSRPDCVIYLPNGAPSL
ncbi:MAG: DNA recombination protein RmuC, partial [Hyphomicrobiaceae bacterium]|nr:DNA recombination protein RmuC [Hyphomicrobiaceae bacterium]